ncbi:MAG: sulfatase [Kiritimatiellales bacterium]
MMKRREFISTTAMAGTFAASTAGVTLKRKRPNLLFVFSDQHRRQAMGFMHEDPVITPVFDDFAKRALVFTSAVAEVPISSPNRACLLTGCYTQNNTVHSNDCALPLTGETLGDVLKQNGYSTGYVGKWHLNGDPKGHHKDFVPRDRRHGWDYWFKSVMHWHFTPTYYGDTPEIIREEGWIPERTTDKALDFILNKNAVRDTSKPFALVVSYAPPHNGGGPGFETKWNPGKPQKTLGYGYAAPERFEALYQPCEKLERRPNVRPVGKMQDSSCETLPGYFGAITSIDEQFGRMLEALRKNGELENTIIVYTADHGEMLGSQGRMTKGIWYEESIGVPMLISWPGKIPAGKTDEPFNSIDLMPSLLGLMELPVPARVDGTDFSPLMRGQEMETPGKAFIQFDKGLFYGNQEADRYWRGVRTKKYTYVLTQAVYKSMSGDGCEVLYDNENDPYQMKPVFRGQDQDEVMDELKAEVVAWLDSTSDPFMEKFWKK